MTTRQQQKQRQAFAKKLKQLQKKRRKVNVAHLRSVRGGKAHEMKSKG